MKINVGIRGLKTHTNILEIKVPERMRQRKPSGIEWFDDAIGSEGFVPSEIMMLSGSPGAGKTTMLMQLGDALTKMGHIVLYNTGEENLYQVKMVAERLNLKNGFIVGQDIMVADVLDHADEIAKANPKKQVFLLQDSLQTLDDGFYKNGGTNSMTPVRSCEMLTNWAKDTYGVVVFIGHVTKNGDFAGKNTILHAIDIHGEIYFDEEKKSETYGERLFEVSKNRFGASGKTFIIGMERDGLYEKGRFQLAKDFVFKAA